MKPFSGDTGLSLSLITTRDSDGRKELSNVVDTLEKFYKSHLNDEKVNIPKKAREVDENSLLYKVNSSKKYIGSVKVTPKGRFAKPPKDNCPDEDFPIADRTTYCETYWLNFFPKDKLLRAYDRDGYITFVKNL